MVPGRRGIAWFDDGVRHHGGVSVRPAAARVAPARAGTAPRSSSRPAGRASTAPRAAGGGSGSKAPARGGSSGRGGSSSGNGGGGDDAGEPRQITLRSAGLVLVVLVAFIVLAPTLRAYVTQQEQLRDINATLADTNARVDSLQEQLDRWADPEYVKSQARDRFGYVLPGETVYKAIDPETITGEDPMADLTASGQELPPYATASALPWYATVWDSVEIAGAAQAASEAPAEDPAVTPVPSDGGSEAPVDPAAPAPTP